MKQSWIFAGGVAFLVLLLVGPFFLSLIPPPPPIRPVLPRPWSELTAVEREKWMRWRIQKNAADPLSDWKTPIQVDGLVIDEKNKPLPDVKVDWITTNMKGNGRGSTSSGPDGRFFINTTGKGIELHPAKEGYRWAEGSGNFEFANFSDSNYYNHDKDHPAVFNLRKIPAPEPVYIRRGQSRNIVLGDKISINPVTGQLGVGALPEGMWIQFLPGPQNGPDREQCYLVFGTGPGGGVLLASNSADACAPDSGYQNPLDSRLMIDAHGHRQVACFVFFKDEKGKYGSNYMEAFIEADTLILSYSLWYNPKGGKSLSALPDSEFQINK